MICIHHLIPDIRRGLYECSQLGTVEGRSQSALWTPTPHPTERFCPEVRLGSLQIVAGYDSKVAKDAL